jgi:ATP-dependent DNA helicase RecQ
VRLLEYFGEPSQPCGNCDICITPPQTWDATTAVQKALSAIYRTEQRFGAVHLIEVLRGKESERIQRWDHQHLSVFGIGKELDDNEWRGVFRQLVAMGFVRVDQHAFGALRLTEAARPILRGEQKVAMRRVLERVREKSSRKKAKAPVEHDTDNAPNSSYMTLLKDWRLTEANQQGVPAYVIFHDATLAEIAARQPTSLEELAEIPGIGKRKLERYGEALIELIGQGA